MSVVRPLIIDLSRIVLLWLRGHSANIFPLCLWSWGHLIVMNWQGFVRWGRQGFTRFASSSNTVDLDFETAEIS